MVPSSPCHSGYGLFAFAKAAAAYENSRLDEFMRYIVDETSGEFKTA
jgi:hypothetical protein